MTILSGTRFMDYVTGRNRNRVLMRELNRC